MFYLADFAYIPLSTEKLNKIATNTQRQNRIAKKNYFIMGQSKSRKKYNLGNKNPDLLKQKESLSKLKPNLEGIEKTNNQIEDILGKQERLNRIKSKWDTLGNAPKINPDSTSSVITPKKVTSNLGRKVALGLGGTVAVLGGVYVINKRRKSRSDLDKIRGVYY